MTENCFLFLVLYNIVGGMFTNRSSSKQKFMTNFKTKLTKYAKIFSIFKYFDIDKKQAVVIIFV